MLRTVSIFLFAGSLFAQAPVPSAQPIDPAKLAAIEDLIALTHPDQAMKQALSAYETSIKRTVETSLPKQFPRSIDRTRVLADVQDFENQIFALMADRLDFQRLKPQFVQLVADTYTPEELTGIVSFYKSPVGKALLEKQPQLMQRSMQIGEQAMQGALPEIQKMTQGWIESMKIKYGNPPAN